MPLTIHVPGLPGRAYREGDALDYGVPLVWTLDGLMSPDECRAMIERIDALGPAPRPSGGETAFLEHGAVIRPRTGTTLLFPHPMLHEGCEVRSGVKYALRSDVMYRRGG